MGLAMVRWLAVSVRRFCTIEISMMSWPPAQPRARMSGLDCSPSSVLGSMVGALAPFRRSSAISRTWRSWRVILFYDLAFEVWGHVSRRSPCRSSAELHLGLETPDSGYVGVKQGLVVHWASPLIQGVRERSGKPAFEDHPCVKQTKFWCVSVR